VISVVIGENSFKMYPEVILLSLPASSISKLPSK